jgi:hypothetical protein
MYNPLARTSTPIAYDVTTRQPTAYKTGGRTHYAHDAPTPGEEARAEVDDEEQGQNPEQ